MRPALRKGPLFYKKHPLFSIFITKHPPFHFLPTGMSINFDTSSFRTTVVASISAGVIKFRESDSHARSTVSSGRKFRAQAAMVALWK